MKKFFPQCRFIGVCFLKKLPTKKYQKYLQNELYCTAISRAIRIGKPIVIDATVHPCMGGNFFVGRKNCPLVELLDTYIKKENVFAETRQVKNFLNTVGQNPLKFRYAVFAPLSWISNPHVVLTLATSEIAGRILGVGAFLGKQYADIIPAISSCAAIVRPLLKPDSIHVNLIDYFDRNYQCKGLYQPEEMIISMHKRLYYALKKVYAKTSHGGNVPRGVKIY